MQEIINNESTPYFIARAKLLEWIEEWHEIQKANKEFYNGMSFGGVRGVMVIVVGNGQGNTSSNPGRDWLHFT